MRRLKQHIGRASWTKQTLEGFRRRTPTSSNKTDMRTFSHYARAMRRLLKSRKGWSLDGNFSQATRQAQLEAIVPRKEILWKLVKEAEITRALEAARKTTALATDMIQPPWPSSVCRHFSVLASQGRTVLSTPESIIEKWKDQTLTEWPC